MSVKKRFVSPRGLEFRAMSDGVIYICQIIVPGDFVYFLLSEYDIAAYLIWQYAKDDEMYTLARKSTQGSPPSCSPCVADFPVFVITESNVQIGWCWLIHLNTYWEITLLYSFPEYIPSHNNLFQGPFGHNFALLLLGFPGRDSNIRLERIGFPFPHFRCLVSEASWIWSFGWSLVGIDWRYRICPPFLVAALNKLGYPISKSNLKPRDFDIILIIFFCLGNLSLEKIFRTHSNIAIFATFTSTPTALTILDLISQWISIAD